MIEYTLRWENASKDFKRFDISDGQLRTLEAGIKLLEEEGYWLAGIDKRECSFELGGI